MAATPRYLRGIVHAHSTCSFDGSCGYAELRRLFIDAGLDFACMTEHIEYLDQADIDRIIENCRHHSDDTFLFVPGIEMDCFFIYFLGISSTTVDFTDNRSIYESLRANARMCVLSHPIKARFRYPRWILDDCDAVEIMNNKHDGKFYFRPQSEKLLHVIRRSRPGVVALVGMDFHHRDQLCPVHIRLTEPVPLDEEQVLTQLAAGHTLFYHGERCMSTLGPLARYLLRARVHVMDGAHRLNRSLSRAGLRVPGRLRRRLARMLEGG